jgi:hypothetical protein
MNYSEDSEEETEMEMISLKSGPEPTLPVQEPLCMEPILDIWRRLRDHAQQRHLHLLDDPAAGESLYEIFCTKM